MDGDFPDTETKQADNTKKARNVHAAVLNEICEEFDHDPDIMKRIEGLDLEEVIKGVL